MARYLIVAHETATNPRLVERVKQVAQGDPDAEFVLLVPATPVRNLVLLRAGEGKAESVALRRARDAQKTFAREGVKLTEAKVGDPSPLDAVDDEVKAGPAYAGFIVSTLPREHSRWLRLNLPRELEAKYGLPVHHVELDQTDVPYVLP